MQTSTLTRPITWPISSPLPNTPFNTGVLVEGALAFIDRAAIAPTWNQKEEINDVFEWFDEQDEDYGAYDPATLVFLTHIDPEPGYVQKQAIDAAFLEINGQGSVNVLTASEYNLSGYTYAVLDEDYRILVGSAADYDVLSTSEYALSGYNWAITDEDYRVMAGYVPYTYTPPVTPYKQIMPPVRAIAIYGDSRASSFGLQQALAAALSTTYPNLPVYNVAVSGQTSREIIARQGSRKALMTFTGNQIPASGSVVVTHYDINPVLSDGSVVEVMGVNGTMTRSVDEPAVITFTRTAAGSVVTVPPNTEVTFVPYSRAGNYIPDHRQMLNIFWMEMNSFAYTEIVAGDYQTAIDYLNTGSDRYIVIGPTTQISWGTPDFRQGNFQQFRAYIADTYAGRTVDPWAILRKYGNGGTDDNADIAAGLIPRSLMYDGTHQTDTGSGYIVNDVDGLAPLIISLGDIT